jgi:hypothetical protein
VLTLWDLLEPVTRVFRPKAPPARAKAQPRTRTSRRAARPTPRRPRPGKPRAAERYETIVRTLLDTHGIRVRKWRKSSSGVAVVLRYRDGTIGRYIECPRPRGALSLAIALHEIGHHVLGVGSISPRCLEEWAAWDYALRTMEAHGVPVTDRVCRRVDRSLRYAVDKARRRGLTTLPPELAPYAGPGGDRHPSTHAGE